VIYRSSQDPRFVVPRVAAAVLTILSGATLAIAAPLSGGAWPFVLAAGALLLGVGLSSLAAVLYVRLELNDFELVVRRGAIAKRIPLECIEGVLPVRRTTDGPRPLPPHVTIVYQRAGRPGVAVLMPEDPDAFVRDLARGAPFLEKIGDRLLRRPGLL
jgi:hypothetical protein